MDFSNRPETAIRMIEKRKRAGYRKGKPAQGSTAAEPKGAEDLDDQIARLEAALRGARRMRTLMNQVIDRLSGWKTKAQKERKRRALERDGSAGGTDSHR